MNDANRIHRILIDMANVAEQRGDLGPWRVWDEFRNTLTEDEHATIAASVRNVQGATSNRDLVSRLRREAAAFA